MREFIKSNGQLVEDTYVFPNQIGDNMTPVGAMEIDSIRSIFLKLSQNPNTYEWPCTGGMDADEQVGDLIWFSKVNSNLSDDYLKCDGSTFNIIKYPKLYEYLGTNTTPALHTGTTWLRGAGQNSAFSGNHINVPLKSILDGATGVHSHTIIPGNHTHTTFATEHTHGTSFSYNLPKMDSKNIVYGNTSGAPIVTNIRDANVATAPAKADYTIDKATPTIIADAIQDNTGSNDVGNPKVVYGVYYIRAK